MADDESMNAVLQGKITRGFFVYCAGPIMERHGRRQKGLRQTYIKSFTLALKVAAKLSF